MVTYIFSNIDWDMFRDKFGIIVSIRGEKEAINDLAIWYSEQQEKNDQSYSTFLELIDRSRVEVDIYCVEVAFYFLCLYLTLLNDYKGDIPSVVDFSNTYITNKRGDVSSISLDNLTPESLLRLNLDLVQTVTAKMKSSFSYWITRLNEHGSETERLLKVINEINYKQSLFCYLFDRWFEDHKRRDKENDAIQMSSNTINSIEAFCKLDQEDNPINYTIIEDEKVLTVLQSLDKMVYDILQVAYEKDETNNTILAGQRVLMIKNMIKNVWMTSSWTSSSLFTKDFVFKDDDLS